MPALMAALHIQVHVAFTYFYLNKRSGYLWTAENNSWSSFCCLWLSSGQSQFFSPISVRMNICQHLDELLTPFPSYSPSLHVIQHNVFKLCRWNSAAAQCSPLSSHSKKVLGLVRDNERMNGWCGCFTSAAEHSWWLYSCWFSGHVFYLQLP